MIMPASDRIHALRQSREACLKTLKINYRIAVSYQIAPTTRFAAVYCASLRRLLQNLGLNKNEFNKVDNVYKMINF
jgi:hypothetical protein